MSSTQTLGGGNRRQLSEGFLDRYAWIADGCSRLMKTGGGSISVENKRQTPVTAEQRTEIIRLAGERVTQKAIGAAVGISRDRVSKVLKAAGIRTSVYRANWRNRI